MKKTMFFVLLLWGLNLYAKEAEIIICECSLSGSVMGTSTTVSYEYGALGDCDHPAAGYGVATSNFGGSITLEQVSNQEASEQCGFFNFSEFLCDWVGVFC